MFKSLIKNFKGKLNSRQYFSTSQTFIYPDQIISQLQSLVKVGGDWSSMEAMIVERINFFDADQFVDTVSLLAEANQGSQFLWDILSRKVFDYELDVAQSYMLLEVLNNCTKHEYFMTDNMAINNLVWDLKWPKSGKVFVEKLL